MIEAGANPGYLDSGHLTYTVGSDLFAVPFDPRGNGISGVAVEVVQNVWVEPFEQIGQLAVSRSGTLVYLDNSERLVDRPLLRVEPGREAVELSAARRGYAALQISPDGLWLAAHVIENEIEMVMAELARPALVDLPSAGGAGNPVFSPDSSTIAFIARPDGPWNLYRMPRDGGETELLFTIPGSLLPTAWSSDGRWIVANRFHPATLWDIVLLDVDRRDLVPFRATENPVELGGRLSPDGAWMAYTAYDSASDRLQVYVERFPEGGQRRRITADGGGKPLWSRDGSKLYYVDGSRLIEVEIGADAPVAVGAPRIVYEAMNPAAGFFYDYAEAADGSLVLVGPGPRLDPRRFRVVTNWGSELEARVR